MRLPAPVSRVLRFLDKWFRILTRPLQIVSNFVFLTVTYFLGIGLSSVFYKLGPGKKKIVYRKNSFWQPMAPAPKEKEAWMRPF